MFKKNYDSSKQARSLLEIFIMLKKILKIFGFFAVGMVGGIFAEQVLWPYFVERPFLNQYGLEQQPVYVTERKEVYIQENTALENAIEKVGKMAIGVKTKTAEGKVLEGSGLIVTSDGLAVTLADLVPQGANFSFFVGGNPVSYQILKRDLKNNLALIKIGETNLPTASFADFAKIKLGERVFLVGNIFEAATSAGYELIPLADEGIIQSFNENLITTNIFSRTLISGSPLFNIEGEVLGINTIDAEGTVITIPVSKIKTFIGL